jgi:hypothetical protein
VTGCATRDEPNSTERWGGSVPERQLTQLEAVHRNRPQPQRYDSRMAAYIARFSYRLRTPIRTSAGRVSIVTAPTKGLLRRATLAAEPADGFIRQFEAEALYEGDVVPMGYFGASLDQGMTLVVKGSFNMFHPPLDVAPFLAEVLYNLSGLTLQSHIFIPIDEMGEFVNAVTWQMPSGETYPGMKDLSWPYWTVMTLRDDDSRIATTDDFATLQRVMDGNSNVPLWRLILADAHRRRGTDLRDIVIRCATALDVGVTPLLGGKNVNMRLFRGEVGATPDLRTIDPNLFQHVNRLWYTRHGIVHHGKYELFDDNPQNGAASPRTLDHSDVDGFLNAVPRAVDFVQKNPP